MNKIIIKNISIEKLQKCINELRDVLNELCVSSEETETNNEKLIVSQYLDELIVEYMNRLNKNAKKNKNNFKNAKEKF